MLWDYIKHLPHLQTFSLIWELIGDIRMSSSIELSLFTQRRLRRQRTISSDSGCCLGESAMVTDREELDDLLEELTHIWMENIETVVIRGVAKLKENVCPDEKYALESTKIDLLSLIDSIPVIVEKENIKIKEQIESKLGLLFDRHTKLNFVNDMNIKKRKAEVQIQNKYAKLRKYYPTSKILHEFYDDTEEDEMFDDWDWSSDEWEHDTGVPEMLSNPTAESISPVVEMSPNESDSPWNDFNFWRFDLPEDLPRIPDDVLSVELLNGDLIGHYLPESDDLVVEADNFAMAVLNIWSFLEMKKAKVPSKYFVSEKKRHWARERQHFKSKIFHVSPKKIFFKTINIKQPRTRC